MFVVCKSVDCLQVLCQDNCWRRLPSFGTCSGCVKEYRTVGWAYRKAKHIGGDVYRKDYWLALVELYHGQPATPEARFNRLDVPSGTGQNTPGQPAGVR